MTKWNLLVKGGLVVDPSMRLHRVADVGVSGGTIADVEDDLDPADAEQTVDAAGKLVTAGFIDLHTHNYVSGPGNASLDADSTSLANGATTVLDAGTATPIQFPHYWETDIQQARTRLFSLIRMPDPYGPDPATVAEMRDTVLQYPD